MMVMAEGGRAATDLPVFSIPIMGLMLAVLNGRCTVGPVAQCRTHSFFNFSVLGNQIESGGECNLSIP